MKKENRTEHLWFTPNRDSAKDRRLSKQLKNGFRDLVIFTSRKLRREVWCYAHTGKAAAIFAETDSNVITYNEDPPKCILAFADTETSIRPDFIYSTRDRKIHFVFYSEKNLSANTKAAISSLGIMVHQSPDYIKADLAQRIQNLERMLAFMKVAEPLEMTSEIEKVEGLVSKREGPSTIASISASLSNLNQTQVTSIVSHLFLMNRIQIDIDVNNVDAFTQIFKNDSKK